MSNLSNTAESECKVTFSAFCGRLPQKKEAVPSTASSKQSHHFG